MADNSGRTPGSGEQIASDDIAGIKHQRVKISIGPDGSAADLDYGQEAMAGSLPVVVASDQVLKAEGKAAHDAGVSGNPVLVAGGASAAAPTAVSADGDVVIAWLDRNGRVVVVPSVERKVVSATYTRPANTTAYAAGDAVSDSATTPAALTFASVSRQNGGKGRVIGAMLLDSAVPTVPGFFELWLFVGTPVIPDSGAAFDDNVAFALPDTEVDGTNNRCIGIVQFNAGFSTGLARLHPANGLDLPFTCNAANNSIWGLVVVRNGYQSSVNSNTLKFTLEIEGD